MSDKPEGPGWWIATDGKWYPPELHPSFKDSSGAEPATATTPSGPTAGPQPERRQAGSQGPPSGQPERRQGPGHSVKPATAGRQFPDLFQKALQGSHLADNVTVKYDGDDERNGSAPAGPAPSGSMRKMTPGGGTPVAAGTAGVTFAAPAKRKWRKGH